MIHSTVTWRVLSTAFVSTAALLAGCSDDGGTPAQSSGGASSGGAAQGGSNSSAKGGATSTGGVSKGGATSTGGNTASTAQGGATSTSTSPAQGGATSTTTSTAQGGATSTTTSTAQGGATSTTTSPAQGGATSTSTTAPSGGTSSVGGASSLGGSSSLGGATSTSTSTSTLPTLHLVGDSTVSAFNDPYYYPRYGYGTQIGSYLKNTILVDNLALSGRSSKSFVNAADNSNYALLTSSLKTGDYLLIGFGHNDEKADPGLYTNPNTDVTDTTSFKYYLYHYYIQPAIAAGATPILATPIVRRDSSGAYAGAKAHVTVDVTAGGITYAGGDYPKAIRELGAAYNLTVIDNTAMTMALGKEIFAATGATGTANLQAWVSNSVNSVDDTHTNVYGASYYAYLIADAVAKSQSTLKDYVLPGITPPALSLLVPNPSYVPSTYAPPVKSSVWTTTDPWMGSVFGDVGGATKITDGSFGITESSPSPLAVSLRSGTTTASAGKIAAATDGIAFYFQKIPLDRDFILTAKATVTFISYANSQVGFGLMVRDAAWTDTSDAGLLSSYVACGPLKGNLPASAWYSFIRDTAATTQLTGTTVNAASAVPTTGSVVTLTITKSGATYTCAYGSETPKPYTLDLNRIDTENVYAGLFTARMADVAFSDISLTLTN